MISVTDPIQRAIEWTQRVCFRPFNMEKWFALGFCSFLAELGGGGYNYRAGNLFSDDHAEGPFREVGQWISAHHALAFSLIGSVVLILLLMILLFMWLGSRGQFMFLDGVVHDRGWVADPWHRFRDLGNQLFRFQASLFFGFLLITALMGGAGALAFITLKRSGEGFSMPVIVVGGILIAVFVAIVLAFIVFELLLKDFVVPIMYARNVGVVAGFQVLRRDILPGHGGTFVLFYLMKLALGMASAVVILLGMCLTCCIAALPYLSSVVFLPVFVFFRSYSLHFLEQFGGEWKLIGMEAPQAEPQA